ncbi:MAG: hypothetical protein MH321_11395 [Leptospiraceae bacterium]|nr:hypothetical protein [Leptospiraceae bacterium]
MNENTISTIAMALCLAPGFLHSLEVVFPMFARLIVNYVLPFFGPGLPNSKNQITYEEQVEMLDSAIAVVKEDKKTAAKDYIFVILFEQRQGSLAFLSLIVGIIYALAFPLTERAILHLVLLVMSIFFMLVNANHAGIPFLGNHPKVSRNGRNVGIVFSGFWLAASILNYLAFTYATQ